MQELYLSMLILSMAVYFLREYMLLIELLIIFVVFQPELCLAKAVICHESIRIYINQLLFKNTLKTVHISIPLLEE